MHLYNATIAARSIFAENLTGHILILLHDDKILNLVMVHDARSATIGILMDDVYNLNHADIFCGFCGPAETRVRRSGYNPLSL